MIFHYCIYWCPFFTRTLNEDCYLSELLSQPNCMRRFLEVIFVPSPPLPGVLEGCISPHLPLHKGWLGK